MGDGRIRVADAMSTRPLTVPAHISLDECARLMKEHDVGSVIVGTGSVFVGLVTEQLIVHRVIAQRADSSELTVGDIMETDATTVHPSTDLSDAMRMMITRKTRHLPVIDNDRLVGFLTVKDLLAIQPALIEIYTQRIYQEE